MTSLHRQSRFDISKYPHIKPTIPRHKTLRICGACKKPGYMYLQQRKTANNNRTSIYFIHYNEPPISLIKRTGRAIRFEYRRCTKNGMTFNTLEEALAEPMRTKKKRQEVEMQEKECCMNMDEEQRLEYIFEDHEGLPILNRFSWFYALLDDIQTLIDGALRTNSSERPSGGGNLSIPILVCTGLELVSSLYAGKTHCPRGSDYNASDNVSKFIFDFFPDSSAKRITRILWDGIRNGLNHVFMPNVIKKSSVHLCFSFVMAGDSQVIKVNNKSILIKINSIELYKTFKRAILNYKKKLRIDKSSQCNFVTAWTSLESGAKDVKEKSDKFIEMQYLQRALEQSNHIYLFRI